MKINVLGVEFDNVTLSEAVSRGLSLAQEGFHYVVTPNPELVTLARNNPAYREVLNAADLVLPDGIGVIYAAKMLGRPLKERVPGIDFASGLLAALAAREGRLFLLGARPGIAEKAGENLARQFPGLVLCGTHHGYFSDDAPVVEAIRAAQPDVVFVCLGAPKQELWMARHGPATGAHLMVGLGGALDVYAGVVKRAPQSWQKLGLEWLYRLLRQPSRLGRMARLPLFLGSAALVRIKGE